MTYRDRERRRLEIGEHTLHTEHEREIHEFKIRVPADLGWFRGHFPGNPVLPAVVQLHEVYLLVGNIWPDLVKLRQVARTKFQSPIRPMDALTLHLHRTSASAIIGFRYVRDTQVCSSGSLEFELSGSDQP